MKLQNGMAVSFSGRLSTMAAAFVLSWASVAQAQYTWTGNGVNGNWNNTANWGGAGFPNGVGDTATFNASGTYQPTFTAGGQFGTLTVNGVNNWTFGGTYTVTNNSGIFYNSTGISALAPLLVGAGGVTLTAGVLTNSNAGSLYTGNILIQGGTLDVTAAAFNMNAASAAGSNANPVVIGDVGSGVASELRISKGGNRGITVQNGGTGTRTIRFTGGQSTYTNTYALNADTILAPGYLSDTPAVNTYSVNSQLTGTGSVIVANGVGSIGLGNTNNTYTGRTIINAGTLLAPGTFTNNLVSTNGIFGMPATGNEEILLGDTTGTNNATLYFGTTLNIFRPLRVRAGSSGKAYVSVGNGTKWYFYSPITLGKDLYFIQSGGYNSPSYIYSSILGGATPGAFVHAFGGNQIIYQSTNNPTHTGGTRLNCSGGTLTWTYPTNAALPVLAGNVVTFGYDTNSNPGLITLDPGTFGLNPAGYLTLNNPFLVTTNNGSINSDSTTSATNVFTGAITLAGRLTLGAGAAGASHQGTITVDQSTGGARELYLSQTKIVQLTGHIVDGAGTAKNSMLLRVGNNGTAGAATFTIQPITVTNTYAYGTYLEANDNALGLPLLDVVSTGTLGSGDVWLAEGARMRLSQPSNVAAGAKVGMWANNVAQSVLIVTTNFVPTLRSDAAGVLAVDYTNFTAVTDLSTLGNGKMFMGSVFNGAFVGTTLSPAADGIYRLGCGSGTLTVKNSVLAGAGNSVQVGDPCADSNLKNPFNTVVYPATGNGTLKLLAANTYGGGSVVNPFSTLEGQAQVGSASPFGSITAPVTLNSGTLQLDGASACATNTVGPLTANGAALVEVNQTLAPTNTLVINSVAASATPNLIYLLTSSGASASLGAKERIVIANNPPVPVNNMIAPNWLFAASSGIADFATYSNVTDSVGTIGFKTATNAYVNVNTFADLSSVGANGIANLTNAALTLTLTGDVSVYALRVQAAGGEYLANDGSYHTITVGSGGVIVNDPGYTYVSNNVSFGSATGMIYAGKSGGNNYNRANFYGQLIGTNGVNITGSPLTGPKAIYLYGNSSASLTGTVAILRGVVNVTNDNAFGAPANVLVLNGSSVAFNNAVVSRPLTMGTGGGLLNGVTCNGPITGPGLLASLAGGATVSLGNTNNTYSGGSAIGFTMNVATNSSMGVGDAIVASTLNLYGDRNLGGGDFYGSNTTNRPARLSIEGNGTVNFYSLAPSVGSLSGSGSLTLTNNAVLTVGADNSSTIYAGIISQSTGSGGSLYKTGTGTFAFKGRDLCSGTTVVNNGTFIADGFMVGGVTVNSGATLTGAGAVGAVTLNTGATFQPGGTNLVGTLTASGALTLSDVSNTVMININGTNKYDQIVANGVTLAGATLQVNLNYAPSVNDVFYIVRNTSASATSGTFAGLPENSLIHLPNGYVGRISYLGIADGDAVANDVKIFNISKGLNGSVVLFEE